MKTFIPFEKLSKKEKQKINESKRGTWYGINPVTKKPDNPKAYNRAEVKRQMLNIIERM